MVLLVDDDDDFRAALMANLREDGRMVRAYASPRDVPPLRDLEQLSLLILDYQMDGENGLAFADRFHATHPDVPIVMLTAYWSTYLDAAVADRPFIRLRRKPVDYEELAALLPAPH